MDLTADMYTSIHSVTKRKLYNALIYCIKDYEPEKVYEPIRVDSYSMDDLIEKIIQEVYKIYEDNTA